MVRCGELNTFKDTNKYNFSLELLSRLCSHGLKRRNYKLMLNLFSKFRTNSETGQPYQNFASIIDPLILRFNLLQITQRGKKFPIALPVTRKLAISIFMQDLVRLARKNNIYYKDLPNYYYALLNDSKNGRGPLYSTKQEAYNLAKQNSFAIRKLYIAKNNKKLKIRNK